METSIGPNGTLESEVRGIQQAIITNASQPVVMNNTGSFGYYQADVNNEDPDYVMNGTINVVDQPDNPTSTVNTGNLSSANIDTVGTLMVPTEELSTHTSELESGSISVLSTHNFNDIRGGDPQTLTSSESILLAI